MRRAILTALVIFAATSALGLFPLGCVRDADPVGAKSEKAQPRIDIGKGDDDQPSRGQCELLGDADDPYVVGKTPLPQDPRTREVVLRAIAAARSGRAPRELVKPAGCAGVPHCDPFATGVVHCQDGCSEWFHVRLEIDQESYDFCTDYRSGDQIYCPWSGRGWTKPERP